jgi:hypothetical protein
MRIVQGERITAAGAAWRRRRQLRRVSRHRAITSRFSSRHHLSEVASGDRDRRSEPHA